MLMSRANEVAPDVRPNIRKIAKELCRGSKHLNFKVLLCHFRALILSPVAIFDRILTSPAMLRRAGQTVPEMDGAEELEGLQETDDWGMDR
jgi:hypothetical protein